MGVWVSAVAVVSPGPVLLADELDLEHGLGADLEAELEMGLGALLGLLAPSDRPWLQQTVASLAPGVWVWLRQAPGRAAGWGAGPGRVWCAW